MLNSRRRPRTFTQRPQMAPRQTNATSAGLSPAKLRPMEAKLVDALPTEGDWQLEPKWDGFRCLVFRSGKKVQLMAKSGKPLSRYFPEINCRCLRSRQTKHLYP